jgi:hypothetical protein
VVHHHREQPGVLVGDALEDGADEVRTPAAWDDPHLIAEVGGTVVERANAPSWWPTRIQVDIV